MEPTDALIKQLYREKLERARSMTEEERLREGPRLFDFACEWTKAGIRLQHPGASEAEVLEMLRQRLALADKLERIS